MSELALKLIAEEKKNRTGRLDLARCGLTEWPEELWELIWLEELVLGDGFWDFGNDNNFQSKNDGKPNKLNSIPNEINKLSNLRVLICCGSNEGSMEIQQIPNFENLGKLEYLDLSRNKISAISGLDQFTRLQRLNLSDNKITQINGLDQLTKLKELNLSANQISEIECLDKLTNLRIINLIYNNISELKGVERLTKLHELNLGGNQVPKIKGLDHLTKLRVLDLNYNKISEIEGLDNLTNIKELNLSGNEISEIKGLEQLKKLQELWLDNNRITEIKGLEQQFNLQKLWLDKNKIRSLSNLKDLLFTVLKGLVELKLSNNPVLDVPLSLISDEKGLDCYGNLKSWFEDCERGTENNISVKLFISGNGNTGKSSLVEALKHRKCTNEPESTHGIIIDHFEIKAVDKPVRFHIWDFGGQEIYHGTHRLFYSSDAVYIIVTDAETEQLAQLGKTVPDRIEVGELVRHQQIGYWLDMVTESDQDSAIVLVQNKTDLSDKTLKIPIDPRIRQSIKVSATNGNGIGILKETLRELGTSRKEYNFLMPSSWIKARDYCLQNLEADTKHSVKTIQELKFRDKCIKEYNMHPLSTDALLTFLHHTGALYYNKEYLNDTMILDQRWALEAIYKPLERGSAFYKRMKEYYRGFVPVSELFEAFEGKHQKNEKKVFLDFMKSCELCFELNENVDNALNSTLVFPIFLPEKASEAVSDLFSVGKNNQITLRKTFSYLNYHRIHALIVRLGRKTNVENLWKNGIAVKTPEGQWFKMEANYQTNAIDIELHHNTLEKYFIELINEVNKLDPQKRDFENWTLQEKDEEFKDVTSGALKELANRPIEKERKQRTIRECLTDVLQIRPKRIAVSYAEEDESVLDELLDTLAPLEDQRKLTLFYDKDRKVGDGTPEQHILDAFERADGYIILLSRKYLNKKKKHFIHQKEIPIISRRNQDGKIIKPVFCIFKEKVSPNALNKPFTDFDWFKKGAPLVGDNSAAYFSDFYDELLTKFI